MTATNSPGGEESLPSTGRERALDQLADALNAEKGDEKNYHIREALQLLNAADD